MREDTRRLIVAGVEELTLHSENFTPAARADRFVYTAGARSSDQYSVLAIHEPGSHVVGVLIQRQPVYLTGEFPLLKEEVDSLMAQLDSDAGHEGGYEACPWAPDDEDLARNPAWGRVYNFRRETDPAELSSEEAALFDRV